jgi:hypothetical protein
MVEDATERAEEAKEQAPRVKEAEATEGATAWAALEGLAAQAVVGKESQEGRVEKSKEEDEPGASVEA